MKCPKCGEECKATRHHILPRRWFGSGKQNSEVILLCEECHKLLEAQISKEERHIREIESVARGTPKEYFYCHREIYRRILDLFLGAS